MRRPFALLVLALAASPLFAFLPPSYDDAPLRAVAFTDRQHGVAVGDHGCVWHTADAGKTWERAKTGSKASLRAVSFVNEAQGWAVGRTERAGDTSVGVVLITLDGGLTWTEATGVQLPGLNVVKFFDEDKGIAAGDGTAAHPAGLFATADGGKTWAAVPGPRTSSWVSGSFSDLSNGQLVHSNGEVFSYQRGKLEAFADEVDRRTVRAVSGDLTDGVYVGDRGRATHDLKRTAATTWPNWDAAWNELRDLDLHTVTRHGKTLWAAGRPGSVVMKSTDGGNAWEPFKTGWNLPIHSICAASETDVYAVGELGAILKSGDGGKTWALQRAGGQRAAVLFAHAFAKSVPLDALSAVGGRDGYHSAAIAVCGGDEFRLAAAVRAAGGVGTECGRRFPVPGLLADAKPEDLLTHWGKDAEDRLVRQLVLAYRTWQPEVVCADTLTADAGPAEQLVLKVAQKAFRLADDPKAYPEQIETLGLQPFAPKKLLAGCAAADAHVKLDQTAFAKPLVNTPQGYSEPAFGVLGASGTAPAARAFRLVSHRVTGCETHADLTTGFSFAEGGTARRKLPQFGPNLDEFFTTAKDAADRRRTLEGVLLAADTPAKVEAALGLVAGTLKKMPDDMACRTAVGLGRQLADAGRWVPARELFLLAAAKYSTFEDSNEAMRWLLRYYSSGEARQRAAAANAAATQYTPVAPGSGDVQPAAFTAPGGGGVKLTDGETAQLWARACLDLEPKLKAFGTSAGRDPAVMLSTLAAKRQLGRTADAAVQVGDWLKAAGEGKPGADPWRDCIAAELWLTNREAVAQPKPFALCPKADAKPHLDGKLDDECWKGMKPVAVDTSSGEVKEYGTKAYFTYDDEYLYFAVECSHPSGKGATKADKRRRDDDLRGRDRVDILLDLDRDYQTYYRLQVDGRGCVAEDCTGDIGWNPKWFVAADPTDTGWTAEIAVPRTELVGGAFKAGTTWGMNVTRVVPGAGCRTWSGPADAAPRPEGLGLMQFHEGKK